MPIGLPGGDLEPAGQHGSGERDHHQIADCEVVGAAHNAPRTFVPVVLGANVDVAPPDHLAVLLRLVDEVEHPADNQRSHDVGTRRMKRLQLQAEGGEPVRELLRPNVVRQVDVLANPGERGAHQISVPKAAVNLMSPSTMSRMSATPCRNISVRSNPMPNANPV